MPFEMIASFIFILGPRAMGMRIHSFSPSVFMEQFRRNRYLSPAGLDLVVAASVKLLGHVVYPSKNPLDSIGHQEVHRHHKSCNHLKQRNSGTEVEEQAATRILKNRKLWNRFLGQKQKQNMTAYRFFRLIEIYSRITYVQSKSVNIQKPEGTGITFGEALMNFVSAAEEINKKVKNLTSLFETAENMKRDGRDHTVDVKNSVR
jgi:hypothetical protein